MVRQEAGGQGGVWGVFFPMPNAPCPMPYTTRFADFRWLVPLRQALRG